jgi:hypothetical protein
MTPAAAPEPPARWVSPLRIGEVPPDERKTANLELLQRFRQREALRAKATGVSPNRCYLFGSGPRTGQRG